MRCVQCLTTGYTEEELDAHEEKTGHIRPGDRAQWATQKDFERIEVPKFTKDQLLQAMRDAGIPIESFTAQPPAKPSRDELIQMLRDAGITAKDLDPPEVKKP